MDRYLFSNVYIAIQNMECEDVSSYIKTSIDEGLRVITLNETSCGNEGNALMANDKINMTPDNTLVITDMEEIVQLKKKEGYAVVGYERPVCNEVIVNLCDVDDYYMNELFLRTRGLPVTIAKTDRTIIREMNERDIDDLYMLYSYPNVSRWTSPLLTREEEISNIKEYIKIMYGLYGYGLWLVYLNENSNECIGRVGISHREYNDRMVNELGYLIRDDYAGKGYGYETCRAVIDYAKECLNMRELFAFISPDNKNSVLLAKKLSFTLHGKTEEYDVYRLDMV